MLLIIKVMYQPGNAPAFFILTKVAGISAHGRFDGQGMFNQAWIRCVTR
jgi:hypothetical protein